MTPTPERFGRLARSSPWRWDAVSFTCTWSGRPGVRATVQRPDRLRVEDLRGKVLFDGVQGIGPVVATLTSEGGDGGRVPDRPEPVFDDDGLVRSARRVWTEPDGAPMWQDYRWVAMLDPAELVDGTDGAPGTELLALQAVEHGGRAAWEAVLRPTAQYEPRCSCCPLLWSEVSDAYEDRVQGPYADAHRVRLDVQTGICVLTAEVGGPRDGEGHDLRLERVSGRL